MHIRISACESVLLHVSQCFFEGTLKTFLPGTAFLHCSRTEKPLNTLWHRVDNPCCISMADMEEHMDLIIALFQISPEGCSTVCIHAVVHADIQFRLVEESFA